MRDKTKKKKRGAFYVVRKVLNALGVLVILFLMALCAFLIYQRVTGQEPKLFGYRLFEVQTGSMEPTIMTKDTILTKEFNAGDRIDVGDIVVFLNDQIWYNVGKPELRGNYIVHRVKEIFEGDDGVTYIVTKGDHNTVSDPKTPITSVVAKYVTKFGAFFSFIRSPLGIVAIIAALVGVFALMRLIYAVGARKKKNKAELAAADAADETEDEAAEAECAKEEPERIEAKRHRGKNKKSETLLNAADESEDEAAETKYLTSGEEERPAETARDEGNDAKREKTNRKSKKPKPKKD